MPTKRRNNGKNRSNRGNVGNVACVNCGRQVPKDKAIKKFTVRDMIDGSSKDDIAKASAYTGKEVPIPKLYYKMNYCISCAIHNRIVAVRSVADRRVRRIIRERKPDPVSYL
jgi:small subunit ribosomal protein S26e